MESSSCIRDFTASITFYIGLQTGNPLRCPVFQFAAESLVIWIIVGAYYSSRATFSIYILRTDDRRPTDRPRILENFERPYLGNGSSDPLHVWFYVGFSRSTDRMALLAVGPNPRSRPSAVLYNFEWPYLWNVSSDPIRIWFYGKSAENNARGVIRLVTM